MIKCHKTVFITSKEVIDALFECNRQSAHVWNDCLHYAKEKHLATGN